MSAPSRRGNASPTRQAGPRPGFFWRSLTWQLVFLTILPATALVLGIAFGSLRVHQNAMRSLVGERDERVVRIAATALDEQATHRWMAVHGLATLAGAASDKDITTILASFDDLLAAFDGGLAFFRQDGEQRQSIGSDGLWGNPTGSTKPTVEELLAKSALSGMRFVVYQHPVRSDAVVIALAVSPDGNWVAAGAFSVANLVEHILNDAFASSPQAAVVVLGSDKRLLYQAGSFPYTGAIGEHPGVAEALQGKSGVQYRKAPADSTHPAEEHVVTYSPVPALGWVLVLKEPWETAASPALRTSQMAPLVVVPVLLLAVVALWFGARRVIKPLQALESRAAMLAWGDFKAIEEPVGGIEEIRQLQSELILMARKVQIAQASLHGYIGAITAAQEEERRRLARELHDDTIQALIALKQRIQLRQLDFAHEAAGLQEIATLTEQAIENLRRLTRALRPIYLEDLGLVTALEMLAREMGTAANLPVAFQCQGTERRLEPAAELALYRMAQEALSNVVRHAQASHATLHITFTPQTVTVQVVDDGKGFDVPKSPAEFAPGGHYGLLGLYERAELIGARLEIRSTPGTGTQVDIRYHARPTFIDLAAKTA
ncbi:MAG: sensor histidine kinase [Chloroflexota bacterium]